MLLASAGMSAAMRLICDGFAAKNQRVVGGGMLRVWIHEGLDS